MSVSKNILVISFLFPPFKRVGGRRWAKFVKYLFKKNYNVKVLCAQLSSSDNSPWDGDTATYEKNVTRIKVNHHIPYFRRNMAPKTLIGKFWYRVSMLTYKLKLNTIKGDPYDLSIGYEKEFLQSADTLIKENFIKNVIISGGPFRYIPALLQLKKKYADVRFIIDFRDFWTYNLSHLGNKRREFEFNLERETVEKADYIITPAETVKNYFIEKYPSVKDKLSIIPHAFDKEDFPMRQKQILSKKEFKIIYAGSLYPKLDDEIKTFIKLIKQLKQNGLKVSVDIYAFQTDYINLFKADGLSDAVTYHQPIESKLLFEKIQNEYDAVLILLNGRKMTQHFKSSKYYELVYLQKPILYIGSKGDVSDYTQQMKLGFFVEADKVEQITKKIIENKITKEIPDTTFNADQYSFENVTEQLDQILI